MDYGQHIYTILIGVFGTAWLTLLTFILRSISEELKELRRFVIACGAGHITPNECSLRSGAIEKQLEPIEKVVEDIRSESRDGIGGIHKRLDKIISDSRGDHE